MDQKAAELDRALAAVRAQVPDDLFVEAEVYLKAAQWALRYGEFSSKASVDQTLAVLDTGLERAAQLAANKPAWPKKKGSFSRAYRSRIDGSAQPYALTISSYHTDDGPAEWLEVVLHDRDESLNEVAFLYAHDHVLVPYQDHQFIQLDIFGRGNNAYRWAGETDVWEALEKVKTQYHIDPVRIALRGFGMGGTGAWHLGLHSPESWAVVEASQGFVETEHYGQIPKPPPYVHIYDALDYAANAVELPIAAYAGEDSAERPGLQAFQQFLADQHYQFEGSNPAEDRVKLHLNFLIGPKTGYAWEPASRKLSTRFVERHQAPGSLELGRFRIATYTERYNHYSFLTIDQLSTPYQRAEINFGEDSRYVIDIKTQNISRFTLQGGPLANAFRVD